MMNRCADGKETKKKMLLFFQKAAKINGTRKIREFNTVPVINCRCFRLLHYLRVGSQIEFSSKQRGKSLTFVVWENRNRKNL